MSGLAVLRMVASLALVLGVLVLGVWLARHRGFKPLAGRRLGVLERLSIDQRRSLLLVRWDGNEHLLLLAPDSQMLVASRETSPAVPGANVAGGFTSALASRAPGLADRAILKAHEGGDAVPGDRASPSPVPRGRRRSHRKSDFPA